MGRPAPTDSQSLLTGFAVCAICGGAVGTVTRMHGTAPKRHPVRFYGCTINQRRGDAICGNRTVLRQDTLDHVLLAAIGEVLDDRVMDSAVEKALERLRAGQENHLDRKTQIERELSLIENRIDRAMDALLDGGPRDELIARLNQEKARKSALTEELSRLSRLVSVVSLDAARIKQDLRQRVGDVKALLGRHTPQAVRCSGSSWWTRSKWSQWQTAGSGDTGSVAR